MTPKEKAKSLVEEMSKQTYSYQPYAGANYNEDEIGWEAGKKCALISINETIETILDIHYRTYVSIYLQEEYMNIDEAVEYYREVIEEIKKL
jgi:hypothetical protein